MGTCITQLYCYNYNDITDFEYDFKDDIMTHLYNVVNFDKRNLFLYFCLNEMKQLPDDLIRLIIQKMSYNCCNCKKILQLIDMVHNHTVYDYCRICCQNNNGLHNTDLICNECFIPHSSIWCIICVGKMCAKHTKQLQNSKNIKNFFICGKCNKKLLII